VKTGGNADEYSKGWNLGKSDESALGRKILNSCNFSCGAESRLQFLVLRLARFL